MGKIYLSELIVENRMLKIAIFKEYFKIATLLIITILIIINGGILW